MARQKLTDHHMLCLLALRECPQASLGELAGLLGVDVPAVEVLCADLEAAGLIAPATVH